MQKGGEKVIPLVENEQKAYLNSSRGEVRGKRKLETNSILSRPTWGRRLTVSSVNTEKDPAKKGGDVTSFFRGLQKKGREEGF